jgi:hypothetical protein
MIIRKATLKDAEKLAELYYEFYSAHVDMGNFGYLIGLRKMLKIGTIL